MDIRNERTIKKILKALITWLPNPGSSQTLSVLEVCQIAGIARSTFYRYFEDIHDFRCRGLVLILSEVEKRGHFPPRNPTETALNIYLFRNMIVENRIFFKSIFSEPSFFLLQEIIKRKIREIIIIKIDARSSQNEVPKGFEFYLDLLTSTTIEFMKALVDQKDSDEQLTQQFIEFTKYGTSKWLDPIEFPTWVYQKTKTQL